MKLQLEGQSARIRLGEAELDRLLAGEPQAEDVKTPLGVWGWRAVLGNGASLTCEAPGRWLLTIPGSEFRAFAAERPRRDGFVMDLAVPDAGPLQVSIEVDVRESRRRQVRGDEMGPT